MTGGSARAGARRRARHGFPTIGLLISDLHTGANRSLWSSVVEEAKLRGMNCICFAGGMLRPDKGADASPNVIYGLASTGCLDGLLSWASSLGRTLDPEALDRFHARYRALPMVCLSQAAAGAPTVFLDAYHGMRDLMSHLVEVHGFRRIGFIRGPASHPPAEDRYRAYREALDAHGIPFSDNLVTPPLDWDNGAAAPRILLEERGLRPGVDVQAIAAASDLLAFEALRALQSRGYRVPADLALTGFNDTEESQLATPPLTTARMPFREQGARALSILESMMSGRSVPGSVTLPSELVVRQSCGCPSEAVTLAVSNPPLAESRHQDFAAAFQETRQQCVADMRRVADLSEDAAIAWLEPLVEALLSEASGDRSGSFLATLGDALDRVIRDEGEVTTWQSVISVLRRYVLAQLDVSDRAPVEDLFAQARILASEAAGRERTFRQWRAERQAGELRDLGSALATSFEVERLCDVLTERLPRLGIESFYLALADRGDGERDDARLVLARTEKGRAELPQGGLLFPARTLVPPGFLPRFRRYDLVVEPLQFQESWMGYAVFEIGPKDGAVYEAIRGHLANALKGAGLFREAREARLAAEKADLIKTRLLANVSHELRAPLDIILRRSRAARDRLAGGVGDSSLADELAMIEGNAEHQLRVINDLLDLSRAEIDELDLDLALMDPRPVLEEAFRGFSEGSPQTSGVEWVLDIPDRLPVVRADSVRLRQILLNLLSNARHWTKSGRVTLAARVEVPFLRIVVSDTGPGIPPELAERIFEPFSAAEAADKSSGGIGLGLSISRHLAVLHGGTLSLEERLPEGLPHRGAMLPPEGLPRPGSSFIVSLPLPDLSGRLVGPGETREPMLLLISRNAEPPSEIAELCRRGGLSILRVDTGEDWQSALGEAKPAAIAWDLAEAGPGDWPLVRRLRQHMSLAQAPVLLYGSKIDSARSVDVGLTGFIPKSSSRAGLLDLIEATRPKSASGPVLIVDDDAEALREHERIVSEAIPGVSVRVAPNGEEALRLMQKQCPCLVVLDLMMPIMDGFELLDRMRKDRRLHRVPVLVLTNKALDNEDVRRMEAHARVVLQAKGVWSDAETSAALNRSLFGPDPLPPQTSALVKRAVAWLSQNHARDIARWQLAEAVNASEDYVSRVFQRELGLSPWEYLGRYRVHRARDLLRSTDESVKAIAARVGFHDQAYFCRVFRKLTGVTPHEYRQAQ